MQKSKQFLFILILLLSSVTILAQEKLACTENSSYVADWKFLGPFNTSEEMSNQHFGAVRSISVNPADSNEIYIGTTSGGLFHTINRGQQWQCLTCNNLYPVLGVNDILVDYQVTPHCITLATGSSANWYDAANFGVLISSDGGLHWSTHTHHTDGIVFAPEIKAFQKDSTLNLLFAYSPRDVFRSMDNGAHWQTIFSLSTSTLQSFEKADEIISMELDRNRHEIYITTHASPSYSEDDKKLQRECDLIEITNYDKDISTMKFHRQNTLLDKAYFVPSSNPSFGLKVCKQHPNSDTLIINRTFHHSFEHVIYLLDLKTKQVVKTISPNNHSLPEDIYWMAGLRAHQTNPAVFYLACNMLYKSEDSGNTFLPCYSYGFGNDNIPHADIRSIYVASYSADGQHDKIYIGTDGGLSYSSNSGKTFTNLNGTNLPITQFYGLSVSPFTGTISAGSQDNSIMSYVPNENKWIVDIRGDGYDVEYSKRIPGLLLGEYNANRVHRSINDIAPLTQYIQPGNLEGSCNKKSLLAHKNGNFYLSGNKLAILHFGSTQWRLHSPAIPHTVLSMAVAETDTNIIYLSSYWNGLFKSTDGGEHFTDISNQIVINNHVFGNTRIHAITISPYNENELWISLGYLGDYYDVCKPTPRILHSMDGGATWSDYSEGLPVYGVTDIVFLEGSEEALFAATNDGVYFREHYHESWKLFSNHLPKSIIPELTISYCRGKLIAATYGHGLWETDLPNIKYTHSLHIRKDAVWHTTLKNEAFYSATDIIVHKGVHWVLEGNLHMAKGKTIYRKKGAQIELKNGAEIRNDCHENWGGIRKK
ncbi:MAG TPA: hypothetical protein PLU10_01460 [Chitinophagaceae bacterium]|nr:hypothetical protein [Chitinophagaceae bacterium]